MTDPVLRAFREAARHGIDSIGEERLKAMLSKWLDTDGPAAFRAAADSGTIVREDGTDNSGRPLWRLGEGVSETALMQRQPVNHGGRRGPHTAALLHLRARVLEAQIRMRALPAKGFRPGPGEKPDPDGYFWRSTDTNKKYRNREGDDVREAVRRALPDGGSGKSPGGKKPRRTGGAGDDGSPEKIHDRGADLLDKSPLKGASYTPEMGKTLMNINDEKTVKRFARLYSVNNMPVYTIGVTNNKGAFGEKTRNRFASLLRKGHKAGLGKWIDNKGDVYNDVTMILSGISRREAINYKNKYRQQEILECDVDGNYDFI